jgi:DNA-binding MarR family transcriptional regulator
MSNTHLVNPSAQALVLLSLVSKHLLRRGNESFREISLSVPQFDLMQILWQQDNLTLSDLSRFCCCAPPNVTGLVDRLEAERLVSRGADPHDRRATRIRLTDEGRALAGPARAAAHKLMATLEEALAPAELASLVQLLGKLYQHCEGDDAEATLAMCTRIPPGAE